MSSNRATEELKVRVKELKILLDKDKTKEEAIEAAFLDGVSRGLYLSKEIILEEQNKSWF